MAGEQDPSTRAVTVQVTAPSLSYAMDEALLSLTSDEVEVVEITDAGLRVGDAYLVTAIVIDRLPQRVL